MRTPALLLATIALWLGTSNPIPAEENQYLQFVRKQAAGLRSEDRAPETPEQWRLRKQALREELLRAWGAFPTEPAPLLPRKLGELRREGYRVEKVIFQTFPGVWMTANAYVPNRTGKRPALLMVHGHWRGAKQDPVVQARCIGATRLGFFVLVVDAFGAGERGVGRALGEYHGDMTAATLLPPGLPLSGLQVYENIRAVDYLQSRPEVDAGQIGITGASGGGNQSMYAGAWDERFRAVAPVCSVGNYQAYLGAACCMCEVVPGALRFTEEWAVLGMVAPRALLVVNATRDARQFSVSEARISLERTQSVFENLGKPENLRHAVFESGHDYNQAMRETVYGWMALHLNREGDGSPVPEPPIQTEDPEALRCFPGESRPDDWSTIPKFAATHARRLLSNRTVPGSPEGWRVEKERLQNVLANRLLGGFPDAQAPPMQTRFGADGKEFELAFSPEPGITLKAKLQGGIHNGRVLVLLDLQGGEHAAASQSARKAAGAGWAVATLDLRATGELAWPQDKIGRAPDHTTAQWGLWIGRPLLGQWVWDVRRLIDLLEQLNARREIALAGIGPAGLVAMTAAAFDARITQVAALGTLATFISEVPYEDQRLGVIVPGILKELGDVADLAALIAPNSLLISGGVGGHGGKLQLPELRQLFDRTRRAYSLSGRPDHFVLSDGSDGADSLLQFLAEDRN